MRITVKKVLPILRLLSISSFLTVLFIYLASITIASECLTTSDLDEEDQLVMINELFEARLYRITKESADCFLEEFPKSTARKEVMIKRADALRSGGFLPTPPKKREENIKIREEIITRLKKEKEVKKESERSMRGVSEKNVLPIIEKLNKIPDIFKLFAGCFAIIFLFMIFKMSTIVTFRVEIREGEVVINS